MSDPARREFDACEQTFEHSVVCGCIVSEEAHKKALQSARREGMEQGLEQAVKLIDELTKGTEWNDLKDELQSLMEQMK